MKLHELKPNKVVRNPIIPESVQIMVCIPMGHIKSQCLAVAQSSG
jgi:hypothetical protein